MKLVKARVQNYRSVEDSGEFDIGDMTCLVGKNEAGKTAILSALRAVRPSKSQSFEIDETIDYPRRFSTRFDERHPDGEAEVIRTWWKLDAADRAIVEQRFGPSALKSDSFQVHFGFRYDEDKRTWLIEVDDAKCLEHLTSKHALDATERNVLHGVATGPAADKALSALAERSQKQEALLQEIKKCRESKFSLGIIDLLSARQPRFFFTSHFERMSGMVSLNQLQLDKQQNKVSVGDKIFLSFLEYAGTTLEELIAADRREALKAKCEAASNEITEEIFQFWSQNNALEVIIEIDSGKSSDPMSRPRHGLTRAILVAVVLVFGAVQFAHAWGSEGHQVISLIAQSQLTPRAKAEVDRLLAIEPGETLASISTWADEHRNPATARSHYINFPRGDCVYNEPRDCPDGRCVVVAIKKQVEVLGSSATDDQKLTALKFLVHFVGDVHQPLHAGYQDDKGGNQYQLQAFMRGSNLHAVWDSGLIKNMNEEVQAMADRLRATPVGASSRKLDPVLAAQESCAIVSQPGFYPERLIDVPYVHRFTPVVESRLAIAGERLANALNAVFK